MSINKLMHFTGASLSAQRSSQGETVHKQMKDLEFASDREERLKKEIEVMVLLFIYGET